MTIVQLECRPEHNYATFFSQELGNDSDRGTGGGGGGGGGGGTRGHLSPHFLMSQIFLLA